jgi:hypothetical protein
LPTEEDLKNLNADELLNKYNSNINKGDGDEDDDIEDVDI